MLKKRSLSDEMAQGKTGAVPMSTQEALLQNPTLDIVPDLPQGTFSLEQQTFGTLQKPTLDIVPDLPQGTFSLEQQTFGALQKPNMLNATKAVYHDFNYSPSEVIAGLGDMLFKSDMHIMDLGVAYALRAALAEFSHQIDPKQQTLYFLEVIRQSNQPIVCSLELFQFLCWLKKAELLTTDKKIKWSQAQIDDIECIIRILLQDTLVVLDQVKELIQQYYAPMLDLGGESKLVSSVYNMIVELKINYDYFFKKPPLFKARKLMCALDKFARYAADDRRYILKNEQQVSLLLRDLTKIFNFVYSESGLAWAFFKQKIKHRYYEFKAVELQNTAQPEEYPVVQKTQLDFSFNSVINWIKMQFKGFVPANTYNPLLDFVENSGQAISIFEKLKDQQAYKQMLRYVLFQANTLEVFMNCFNWLENSKSVQNYPNDIKEFTNDLKELITAIVKDSQSMLNEAQGLFFKYAVLVRGDDRARQDYNKVVSVRNAIYTFLEKNIPNFSLYDRYLTNTVTELKSEKVKEFIEKCTKIEIVEVDLLCLDEDNGYEIGYQIDTGTIMKPD